MQDASKLFADHLEYLVKDPERWRQLYAENAVLEFPYAPSIGAPERYEGIDAIFDLVQGVFAKLRDPSFTNIRIQPLHEGGGTQSVVAEFEISAVVTATGRTYNQKYIALLTASEGKIVFLREYWNPEQVTKAFGEALPGL